MLEAIGAVLVLVVIGSIRIFFSRQVQGAIRQSLHDENDGNMIDNLTLYEQMKAAKARGEDFQAPSNWR